MNERLYRSRDDRVIGGVCGGLAERLDLDPSIVRIGWVILTFLTGGLLLLLYVVMLIVVPEESAPGEWSSQPLPGAVPGWSPPPAGTSWSPATGPMPGDASAAGSVPGVTAASDSGTPPSPAGATAPAPGWSGPQASPPPGATWMSPWEARAARRAARRERRAHADPTAGLVFGAILVLIGLFFLGRQYFPSLDFDRIWPAFVILIGALIVARAFYRPRPDA